MKRIWIALVLLLTGASVSAEILTQVSFENMGFSGFENNQPLEEQCHEYSLFKDLNKNSAEFYTVVSLRVSFEPVASKDANAVVFLNGADEAIGTANATQFRDGWWRTQLPNSRLREQNSLKVCLNNSNSTTKSILLSDSLYGTYRLAEFKGGDFVKTLSTYKPLWNQEFLVTVSLHNSGSEKVDANILYEKPDISFKHLAFVKGQTSFVGAINAGQTASFSYTMKSTKIGPFTLPAAIVFFKNGFGESEKMVSNYPAIEVSEPEIKIQAVVLNKTTEKKLFPGKPVQLQVQLTNNGQFDLSNIALILPEKDGMVLNGERNQTISLLKPGETKTIDFLVTPTQSGSFEAGCHLIYLDLEVQGTDCEPTRFWVESNSFPIEYAGGIVLVIIAVLVYLYYHFK